MTSSGSEWLLAELIAVMKRLTLPAADQREYLQQLGSGQSADELALELDDVVEAALANHHLMSEAARLRVREVSDKLEEMSGSSHTELWTEEALRTSADWEEVRRRAGLALAELEAAP
jgi:hypothetical protein